MEGAGHTGVADSADEDRNVMFPVLAGLYKIIHLLLLRFLSLRIFIGEDSPDCLGHKLIYSLRKCWVSYDTVVLSVGLLTILDWRKPMRDVLQRGHSNIININLSIN